MWQGTATSRQPAVTCDSGSPPWTESRRRWAADCRELGTSSLTPVLGKALHNSGAHRRSSRCRRNVGHGAIREGRHVGRQVRQLRTNIDANCLKLTICCPHDPMCVLPCILAMCRGLSWSAWASKVVPRCEKLESTRGHQWSAIEKCVLDHWIAHVVSVGHRFVHMSCIIGVNVWSSLASDSGPAWIPPRRGRSQLQKRRQMSSRASTPSRAHCIQRCRFSSFLPVRKEVSRRTPSPQ